MELSNAAERLRSKKAVASLDALRDEGVTQAALDRAVVIEFGNERSMFDAISPEFYVVNGKSVGLHQAGVDLH